MELAGSAASTGCIVGDSVTTGTVITFLVTLAVAVFGSVLFRGFFSTIPNFDRHYLRLYCGCVHGRYQDGDHCGCAAYQLISIPNFQTPKFDINAILIILPVLLVIANEHIGHQLVTGKVIGRDLLKDPGLHRSLFADNFSTMISGFIGSVPTTTYGENIGVMAATKVYSTAAYWCAAAFALILSLCPKFGAIINTIPAGVLGGVTTLLYGMIGMVGIRIWVENKVNFDKPVNVMVAAITMIIAVGQFEFAFNGISFNGIAIGTVVILVAYHGLKAIGKATGTIAKDDPDIL